MNSDLYGKQYKIPESILTHLKKYSGNEVINNLLSTGNASYSQMKSIKHRIENGEKNELGGDMFYNWINQSLKSDRSSLETSKDNKSNTGMPNAHNRSHERTNLSNMNRPSKSHHSNNSDIKITEALKRINQLMSKII